MRVVVAPDAFKGTLTAHEAAAALAEGWRAVRPDDDLVLVPMADGGEGTLAAIAAASPEARRVPVTVHGPDGRLVDASWLSIDDGRIGVVELASTSGIELLTVPLPWDADTTGFGQAIAAAFDAGVTSLVLAIGSSASTDGGTGLLSALAARCVDAAGRPVARGLRGIADVVEVDVSGLRRPPAGGVRVVADVTSPLLGEHGAARAFGPQKGLDAEGVAAAEEGLGRLAELLRRAGAPLRDVDPATPGAGAAGGVGYALLAWGATIEPGASVIADLLDLPAAVDDAGLVVTGEGAFDVSSAHGKVPGIVAALAAEAGVPVALVAGSIAPDADVTAFRTTVSLTALSGSSESARSEAARWLRGAGTTLASSDVSRP